MVAEDNCKLGKKAEIRDWQKVIVFSKADRNTLITFHRRWKIEEDL